MNNIDRAIVLDEAKAYSDRKGGYTKPGKVLTFDGNLTGKTVFSEYVRVSSEIMDLTKAKKVTLMSGNGVEKNEISEGFTVAKTADGVTFLMDGDIRLVMVMEIGGEFDGTYVWYLGDGVQYEGMVSKVEFAETIVPIDPKFLLGVCLPVVKLSTAVTNVPAELTEKESAVLEALAKSGTKYILCDFDANGMRFATTLMLNEIVENPTYIGVFAVQYIGLSKDNGIWYCGFFTQ